LKNHFVGLALALLLAIGLLADPALAHMTRIGHGADYAEITSSHKTVFVCDRENDGHRTYVDWYDTIDQTGRLYDGDGGSCAGRVALPRAIVVWRICEEGVSCSGYAGV
jgi:hypothetical protein